MDSKFFSLGPTWGNKWYWGQVELDPYDEIYMKGMEGFKGVVNIEIDAGTTAGDFIWNSHNLIIISNKVLGIWEQYEKFETYRVKIINKYVKNYIGIVFLGRAGPFDPIKSRAVYSKALNAKGKHAIMHMEGSYFDEGKWNGNDLCTIDEFPLGPIITERVMKDMKKAKVTNCKYTPVEDVKF